MSVASTGFFGGRECHAGTLDKRIFEPDPLIRQGIESALIMPVIVGASAPGAVARSAGYFAVGAVAGGAVNYTFQSAAGGEVKWPDVVNAVVTGGLTFGTGVVRSIAVNSTGAFVAATVQGEDATTKVLAAAGGTLIGAPAGNIAQALVRNATVATAIRYESNTISGSLASAILPANAIASSIAQETVSLAVDRFGATDGKR